MQHSFLSCFSWKQMHFNSKVLHTVFSFFMECPLTAVTQGKIWQEKEYSVQQMTDTYINQPFRCYYCLTNNMCVSDGLNDYHNVHNYLITQIGYESRFFFLILRFIPFLPNYIIRYKVYYRSPNSHQDTCSCVATDPTSKERRNKLWL